ncbi:MAG: hypothetical protein M3Q56_00305 [Bacteroidota bacterium]|nr:hypothetical protein [Bacteroidota bacterium]
MLLLIVGISCKEEYSIPKPRSFPKIDFPQKNYQYFTNNYCPFTFRFPTYATIEKDSTFFDEEALSDCWFNINLPSLNGTIYCTYFPIHNSASLEKYIKDAFKLASQHHTKANYIDELPVHKNNEVSGLIFDIQGPAASPFQFYLTDSSKHFLRASLYFHTQARPDSLAPIYEFIKLDLAELVNSFTWK